MLNQLDAFQIVFGTARLRFYHRLQRFYRERIPSSVGRYGHALPVRMAVALMRSFLPDEIKTIAGKRSDGFSGSERPKATVVDGHGLDGHGDTGSS